MTQHSDPTSLIVDEYTELKRLKDKAIIPPKHLAEEMRVTAS